MNCLYHTVSLFVLASLLNAAEGRIGASHRRRLQHRKLLWAPDETAIPDQYVVVFEEDHSPEEAEAIISKWLTKAPDSTNIIYDFDDSLNTVAFSGVSLDTLEQMLDEKLVAWIEEDQILSEDGMQANPPSWGLDRIDQASLPLNSQYSYQPTGKGVEIYIMDSGVHVSHSEFRGRIRCGYNAVDQVEGRGCEDGTGHGTHVAGTAGGTRYGVAKEATIIGVRCLNEKGAGSLGAMLSAVNYIIGQKKRRPSQPMVVNMSISGSAGSPALDSAIRNANSAGIVFVVSAGNFNKDACQISPARAYGAITVGSTSSNDYRSGFSNFGTCVNIFAPGSSIISAGPLSNTASASKTGTSMAAPHVAGVAALYLELHPTWSGADVMSAMESDGVRHKINNAGPGSPNLLLQVGGSLASPSARETCKALLASCQSTDECCGAFVCNNALGRCFTG